MPFYLRLHAEREDRARTYGIHDADWRAGVLDDVLHDGELEIDARMERDGYCFELYGRRLRLITILDTRRDDTLFVAAIYAGPAKGYRVPPRAFRAPGPWQLLPDPPPRTRGAVAVQDHLLSLARQPTANPPAKASAPRTTTNLGAVLKARMVAVAPVQPTVTVDDARNALTARLAAPLRTLVTAEDPERRLHTQVADLTASIETLQQQLRALPSPADLKSLVTRLDQGAARLHHLGIRLPTDDDASAPPVDLDRTLSLLDALTSPSWNALPRWIADLDRTEVLSRADLAAQVDAVLVWVSATFGETPPPSLRDLARGAGVRLLDQLKAAWDAQQSRTQLTSRLDPLPAHEILAALADGPLIQLLDRVDELRSKLHPDALTQLWALLPERGVDAWME